MDSNSWRKGSGRDSKAGAAYTNQLQILAEAIRPAVHQILTQKSYAKAAEAMRAADFIEEKAGGKYNVW